jgi:hypothetical protein
VQYNWHLKKKRKVNLYLLEFGGGVKNLRKLKKYSMNYKFELNGVIRPVLVKDLGSL